MRVLYIIWHTLCISNNAPRLTEKFWRDAATRPVFSFVADAHYTNALLGWRRNWSTRDWVLWSFCQHFLAELIDDNFLIVADNDRRNLFQVSLDTGDMLPLLPVKPRCPVAVVYDHLSDEVFWTDSLQNSIGRYSLRNRSRTIHVVYRSDDGK
jgi:hypothetical protein